MKKDLPYCRLCGNEKSAAKDLIGPKCREVVKGPMAEAFKLWLKLGEEDRMCCGSLATSKDHLYFHGKYYDASYPLTKKGTPRRRGPVAAVEYGVAFYADYARCYYLRDFDHYCDSVEYGDLIPYSAPDFWEQVRKGQARAAEEAWFDGLRSGPDGYHKTEF